MTGPIAITCPRCNADLDKTQCAFPNFYFRDCKHPFVEHYKLFFAEITKKILEDSPLSYDPPEFT